MSTYFAFEDYTAYSSMLRIDGTVLVPPNVIFTPAELNLIDHLQSNIVEEAITNGDEDEKNIFVRRILIDPVGEVPRKVNQPYSDDILGIIDNVKRRRILWEIFGSTEEFFVRRCQVHRLTEGSRIGLHLDAESNPDNDYAVIIQLGKSFTGGEFIVHPYDGRRQVFVPTYGAVIVTTCKLRHEVATVTSNERRSLNLFYSRNVGINPQDPNVPCSRPGCKWCGEHLRSALA
jgi:hypothetical protein